MSETGFYNLRDVTFQGGEDRIDLTVGAAEGDYITITPSGDEGALINGANGDVMLVSRESNGYTITLNYLQTASAILTLGILRSLGNAFPIFYKNGASEFSGRAILQNRGDETVSSAGGTRTITLIAAKLTDTLAPQGEIFASGN